MYSQKSGCLPKNLFILLLDMFHRFRKSHIYSRRCFTWISLISQYYTFLYMWYFTFSLYFCNSRIIFYNLSGTGNGITTSFLPECTDETISRYQLLQGFPSQSGNILLSCQHFWGVAKSIEWQRVFNLSGDLPVFSHRNIFKWFRSIDSASWTKGGMYLLK